MKDSILKGTGNSRFLKSAIPEGTSWADALAMLQAGTFPIDFNGINTAGFQQVGTPLNKANLLKDATAAQIGLPPSTTPDGMFQALGNTGELHVWRKTTISQQAGYNLGNIVRGTFWLVSGSDQYVEYQVSASLDVSSDGTIALHSPNTVTINLSDSASDANSALKGKFVKRTGQVSSGIPKTIVFIPNSANITKPAQIRIDSYQEVSGYPAGTTTTYPVSTNPNAYQEGSDAKPAGYTLGEVVTGTFQFAPNYNTTNAITYQSCSNLQISNDGAVGIDTSDPSYRQVTFKNNTNVDGSDFRNRFVRLSSYAGGSVSPNPQTPFNGAVPSQIVYIPSDTTFNFGSPSTFDRYQPVTGYAAIPAGTTIEYLGKLGDKARVQVVSYVGTGTYGKNNPNSLTFDFVPKMVIISTAEITTFAFFNTGILSGNFANNTVFSARSTIITDPIYVSAKKDGKTISWYSTGSSESHFNLSGAKYNAIAIG